MQPGDQAIPSGSRARASTPARLVLQLNVVMIFRPVISGNGTPASPIRHLSEQRQREENTDGLMDKCSRQAAGTTPLQWCCSPHGQRGHGLCPGLDNPPRLRECSLAGRYQTQSLPYGRPESH